MQRLGTVVARRMRAVLVEKCRNVGRVRSLRIESAERGTSVSRRRVRPVDAHGNDESCL